MIIGRNFLFFGAIFLISLTGLEPRSYASDKHQSLTDKNITEFIQKTTKLTSGGNGDLNTGELISYFERHLDQNARFSSSMQFKIPGYPPQKKTLVLDKKEFIDQVRQGTQSIEHYDNDIKVHDIKISSDKTKATVQTTGVEHGVMPVSVDGVNTENVPIEGHSKCLQILKLNNSGTIQMYSANCETTIQFQEY